MCAGDQCCPPALGSGGTFPCPSASPSFSGCVNNTKVDDCLAASLVELSTCALGANVQCPGSSSMCAGDQCCPPALGSGGTFPCPSASPSFSGCVNNTKVDDCLAASLVAATA
mmetsp:Transcript_19049/g.50120  ORF Transcript_19049/g.50120 Transcript_19049/m.50120 type:complete len:113 (-) Transcript_19049:144-482(-)